jgi:hypothetical protein
MSSMTFGPPVVLDGPLPVAPPRSLLSVPGVLQDPGDGRWMNGVALWGYPSDVPSTVDPCAAGTYADKASTSTLPTPTFAAFTAYLPVSCSSFSIASDPEGFAMKAERALDATISYAVEQALSQGVPMSTNPFLADASADVLAAGAPVSAQVGFAYLEEAIGATGRVGMIHVTPGAAVTYFDSDAADTVTALGTRVAVGGGYVGADPVGEAAAGAGQSWAYATGPVRVWVESEATLNIAEVLDRQMNDVVFRAEKYVLVEWDTALQAAVLIDWTP